MQKSSPTKRKEFLPDGVRTIIYSFLDLKFLSSSIQNLSKKEQILLENNTLINQRLFYKIILKPQVFAHISKVKKIVDISSVIQIELSETLPEKVILETREFLEYIFKSTQCKLREIQISIQDPKIFNSKRFQEYFPSNLLQQVLSL